MDLKDRFEFKNALLILKKKMVLRLALGLQQVDMTTL